MQHTTLAFAFCALIAAAGNPRPAGNSHHPAGLYASYADFSRDQPSWQLDCGNHNDKLQLNQWFGSTKGYVLVNGEKHAFSKNAAWGYRDCNGHVYRFYNNTAYRVMDTAGFFVYYTWKLEAGPNGKGMIKNDVYYFSPGGSDALQLLTIDNLKKTFPDRHRFHDELDAVCKSDKGLTEYDPSLKTYRVNYLFKQPSR